MCMCRGEAHRYYIGNQAIAGNRILSFLDKQAPL